MDFITIYVLKIELQHYSDQDIITLPITPIANSYYNKHSMTQELKNLCLLHRSDSVMKEMCHHQTLTGLPKYFPNKLNRVPCTMCYTENMTTSPKGTTVDITNLEPV